MLIAAYSNIKSKPGMMTKGTDDVTLDGINKEWFLEQSDAIRKEQYQPKPSRRELIPKPNGKVRPLGISSPRDRIIQQSMKMVMECVIEPSFLDCSHGFRPRRSCHSALKEIREGGDVVYRRGYQVFLRQHRPSDLSEADQQTLRGHSTSESILEVRKGRLHGMR